MINQIMRKTYFILATALLIVIAPALTGCGKTDKTTTETASLSSEQTGVSGSPAESSPAESSTATNSPAVSSSTQGGETQPPASTEKPEKPDNTGAPQTPADDTGYAGLWQASPVVGSGYSRRLALNADGSFYFAESEMDSMKRERFRRGTWSTDGATLTLNVAERILRAGGDVVDDPIYIAGTSIANPEIVLISLPDAVRYDVSELTGDPQVNDKRTFMLGDLQYWELSAERDSLQKDYESAKAQAKKVSKLSSPLSGCWETTDRGSERDGFVRVTAQLNGHMTTVRADWRCMEFTADGRYASWERWHEDMRWNARRTGGRAFTDGVYLFLLESTERYYGGSVSLESIFRIRPSGSLPTDHPCDVYKVTEWNEDSLRLYGYESLINFEGKGDRPPWGALMLRDSLTMYPSGVAQTSIPTPNQTAADRRAMLRAYAEILDQEAGAMKLPDDLSTLRYPDMAKMLDIGQGKVVFLDVTNDAVPELIYLSHNDGYEEWLNIWMWYNGSVRKVFEQRVRSLAGGGGNYSLYIGALSNVLWAYSSESDEKFTYGFWNVTSYIIQYGNVGYETEPYSYIGNRDKAAIFCDISMDGSAEPVYFISGKSASADEAEAWLEDLGGNIDVVLIDSADSKMVNYENIVVDIGLYSEQLGPWVKYVKEPREQTCITWEAARQLVSKG